MYVITVLLIYIFILWILYVLTLLKFYHLFGWFWETLNSINLHEVEDFYHPVFFFLSIVI